MNWGESKDKIWVDKEDLVLYYGLDTVLMCEIQSSEIKVHMKPEWEKYFDGALDDLIHAANTAFTKSLESKASKKGKSKGKHKGSKGSKGEVAMNGKRKQNDRALPPWRRSFSNESRKGGKGGEPYWIWG